jgi:hypothetical protein
MASGTARSGEGRSISTADDEYDLAPAPGILTQATVTVLWVSEMGYTARTKKSKGKRGGVTLGRGSDGDLACVAHYGDDETVFCLNGRHVSMLTPSAHALHDRVHHKPGHDLEQPLPCQTRGSGAHAAPRRVGAARTIPHSCVAPTLDSHLPAHTDHAREK